MQLSALQAKIPPHKDETRPSVSSCSEIASNGAYKRHEPEKTLLYQTVQEHLATFLAQCEASERTVPSFVKKEFEEYLRCGILAHGFARVYCSECRYDRLVAFSCKRRGFCGSCMVRRMSETAAHLVDSVIPEIPTRQWVLSVPAPLRFLMAYDSEVLNVVLNTFLNTVFAWLRKKAKSQGAIDNASQAYPGAVTFVQRFGSALNLNVHLHCQFSDGVFIENDSGFVSFHRTPSPTLEETREISEKVARRMHKWLQKRMQDSDEQAFGHEEPLLAACYASSIRYLTALGQRAGQPLMRVIDGPEKPFDTERAARTVAGYNLHVSIPIIGSDRRGLERQLRYMGRPPLSEERLSKTADGKLRVKLKSAWSDGTSSIILTPMEFLERLVAIVPPPRKNLIRYAGVFAPNSHLRQKIVPKQENSPGEKPEDGKHPTTRKYWAWAKLLARVFEIDILECPRCKSQMQTIAFITDPKAIRDILTSLKMATAPPEPEKSQFVMEQDEFFYEVDYDYTQ